MSTTFDRASRPASDRLITDVKALCVGGPPRRGALARLADQGVTWEGAAAASAGLVFATVPTRANAAQALRLARRLDKPLVLDLATPWALDGRTVYPTPVHLAVDRRAMAAAIASADLVLVSTPDLAAACTELGAAAERVLTVPDGCEPGQQLAVQPGNTFSIWVASTLAPSVHSPGPTQDGLLERRPRQIEPVGATAFYLFSALAALRQKVPPVFARVRVQFASDLDPTNLDIAHWLEVESIFAPSVGRPAAADAVFVCQHGECGGARALDRPDGLWSALATGRPLLAALPPGAGRDLVLGLGVGRKLPATDAPPLCFEIERLVASKAAGTPCVGTPPAWIEQHDSRRIAAVVADALQALVDGEPLPAAARTLWPAARA